MTRVQRRIAFHIANLASPDPKVSMRGEWNLIRFYGGKATQELIAACASPNPTVRVRAVWCLGLAKDPAAYETILALTDDPDERVQYDAVLALGELGDPRAIEPLYRMALEDDETRPAVGGLWRLGFPALEAVERLYRNGKELTRHAAVNCAGGMAEMEHCHERCVALLRAACNDPVGSIRSDAHYWLKELGIEP